MRNGPTLSLEICQYPLQSVLQKIHLRFTNAPTNRAAEHFHKSFTLNQKHKRGHKHQYRPRSAEVHFRQVAAQVETSVPPNEPSSLGKTESWLRSKDKEESPLTLVWSVLPLHMVYIYAAHM